MIHPLPMRSRRSSLGRATWLFVWLIALSTETTIQAEKPPSTITLPRLYKVPLGHCGVDIRHALYHEQGFQPAPRGEVQLEVVDMQPNQATEQLLEFSAAGGSIKKSSSVRWPR